MNAFDGIQFRDRPLKPGETSHWRCGKCGEEIHSDMVHSHKCKEVGNIW